MEQHGYASSGPTSLNHMLTLHVPTLPLTTPRVPTLLSITWIPTLSLLNHAYFIAPDLALSCDYVRLITWSAPPRCNLLHLLVEVMGIGLHVPTCCGRADGKRDERIVVLLGAAIMFSLLEVGIAI